MRDRVMFSESKDKWHQQHSGAFLLGKLRHPTVTAGWESVLCGNLLGSRRCVIIIPWPGCEVPLLQYTGWCPKSHLCSQTLLFYSCSKAGISRFRKGSVVQFWKISNFYLNLPALNHFSFIHSSEVSEGLPILDSALTKLSLAIRLDKMMNGT